MVIVVVVLVVIMVVVVVVMVVFPDIVLPSVLPGRSRVRLLVYIYIHIYKARCSVCLFVCLSGTASISRRWSQSKSKCIFGIASFMRMSTPRLK